MPKQLNAIVLPTRRLTLEWSETKDKISKSTQLLQSEIHRRYAVESTGDWLLFLGFSDKTVALAPSLEFWRSLAAEFTEALRKTPDLEDQRHRIRIRPDKKCFQSLLETAPLMTGAEYLTIDLLKEVWQTINQAFSTAVRAFSSTVETFIHAFSPAVHLVGRVFFHLVENKDGRYPFAFMATYSTRLNQKGASRHLPLKHALQEYGRDSQQLLDLLSTVHVAARKSDFIADLLDTGELFHPLGWTPGEAFRFLTEIPLYENSGILCRMPNWWKAGAQAPSISVTIGDKKPSFVGMDALLNFDVGLCIGDTPITATEARKLIEESEGLAFLKNKWVAVDPEKLQQTLAAYEQAQKLADAGGMSLKDALRLQLAPQKALGLADAKTDVGVSSGKWLAATLAKLKNPARVSRVTAGPAFTADLRDYQQKGLNWLYFLHTLKFGACLADDMGLGKTVQLLAFLDALKTSGNNKKGRLSTSLLVLPASLIANWVSEIRRFAPDLAFGVAHPSAGPPEKLAPRDAAGVKNLDLVITTYALVQKYTWLHDVSWTCLILDEAQAIKNPGTKQARAVKKLSAENRIIMTGTPIENRLSDLWSLFDFLNPGLLGTTREFTAFSKQLQKDPSGYARLRRLISPYILRRLKTDKTVIADLPDKVEMKTWAPLAKKQVVLYRDLINTLESALEDSDGIQRKGLILSCLMKFKQLCNHPDQYLGTGGFSEKESGKFARLREICETIYAKREKVLVFTQFKEMTGPLAAFLETIFNTKGLVLHGSVPVKKRQKIVDQFQNSHYVPFMVLSLKAGGVGLNLTRASHVVHFDRWWNPAVENQATDRAFRIGQQKNVMVHKFITRGTVEEKIDRMLEDKARLSQEVIAPTGEAWITEMKDDELLDLFRLSI